MAPMASARGWKPSVQETPSVAVKQQNAGRAKLPSAAKFTPRAVEWPAATDAQVDLRSAKPGRFARAGKSPVHVGKPKDGQAQGADVARVRVLDRSASEELVGPGVVTIVETPLKTDATVSIDYSSFADAVGAGFGGRLELVSLPVCAVTTPELAECQTQTPVDYTNDVGTQQLTATVNSTKPTTEPASPEATPSATQTPGPSVSTTPSAGPSGAPSASPEPSDASPSASPSSSPSKTPTHPDETGPITGRSGTLGITVLAAVASTTSDQGDYTATSLKPSAAWASGGMSGEFTWSYPIGTPDVPGGGSPELGISYSSGGTDGGVANTNNQASWVGEGFELGSAFIERKYASCYDDRSGGNNSSSNASDLCWYTDSKKTNNEKWDNAFLNMAGHAGELVRVASTDQWRLEVDDGTRVAKIGTIGSNNEYWRVTTPDGTQYFFGKGKADNSSAAATNSKWSVPVAGNHTDEPGRKSAFADSFVSRPWRWNLDYVVAPTGATMTYYYAKETNKYKKNLATSTSYDRGGYLTKIQYGERKGAETVDDSPAKVDFTVEERCDTAISSTCKTAKPTSTTAKAWPDVPMDAVCDADYCPSQKTAPTFFSRKRLKQIDTFTRDSAGTAWQPVDTWALTGSFPKPADGGAVPSLWLASITRTGKAGTAIALPTVTLSPIMLDSRISGGGVALEKPRLGLVTSETGAQTIVTYSTPDCTQGNLPTTAQIPTNTRRCMPVYYSSDTAAPTLQWFNKYVVTKVTERDLTATTDYGVAGLGLDIAADQVTNYTYSADGAWSYNDSPIVKAKYRTWGQWRGYGKVTTTTGTGSVKEVEETTYFRGMNGDRASSTGGTKNVTVTDSTGTTWPDDDWLAGMTRETRTFTGTGGTEDSGEITDPHVQPTMSGSVAVADGRLTSRQVDTAKTVSRQKTASGVRKGSETVLAWDAYGQPTKTEDQGDLAVSGDETCTRAVYAAPATAATGPIDRVAETSVSPGTCSGDVNYATVLSAVRHHYGTASHTDPVSTPALETKTVQLRDGNPRPWVTTATVSFDTWGRPLTTADALGNTSTVSYSHTAGGLVSSSTSTSADPDGAGTLTPLATTVTFDTRLAAPVKTVKPGGETTEATLDALGRVTAVWQPGRAKATQTASSTMAYTISKTAPSSVTTDTLLPNGTGYTTSVSLLDSMLRARQTQTKSAAGGRLVADTRYDSRGNAVLTDSYYNSSAPSASLVQPANREDITNSHRVSYDFAGRATKDALYNQEVFKWETLTSYEGDRTKVTPPAGGTPTTTVEDIEGNTTQLIQHLGSATATTSYTYDLLGRLTAMVDDKGNRWSYSYDLAGNKVTSKDPDKGQTSMTYDAAGQLTSSTDARDVTLKFFYDSLGRATKTTKADGTTTLISTSYDTVKKGLVSSTSRHLPGGTIVNRIDSYDTAGRTTGSSVVVPEIAGLIGGQLAGTYTTTTSYNADGSINTTTLPSTGPIPAETLTTTYTGLTGLPKTLTGSLGSTSATYVTDTQYLQWGTVAAMLFGTHAGKASMATWTRDPGTQRLIGMDLHRQVNPGVTDENTAINYDPAGNITQVKATLPGGQVDNQCFSYDHQQQLTEAWTPTAATCDPEARSQSALAGPAPYWTSWATNTIGKTTSRTDRTPTTSSSTSYSYPSDGATSTRPHFITGSTTTGDNPGTTSYTADAAGNTTKRPAAGGGNQDLVWDELNQLTEVAKAGTTIAKMVYDAAGERVLRQQGDTTTLYVAGSEITLNATTSTLAVNRYYNHAGQTVAMRTAASNDTVSTLVPDWQGTTHHQINNSTGALSTTWQDPYGTPRGTPPTTWEGERGFVGGTKDATGLTRIGARDYDPVLQRFITVDPIQDLADPLQWNPYLYANNSPITKADPTGLWPNWGQLFNGIVNIAKAIYKYLPKPFKKALAPVKRVFKSFNWGAKRKSTGVSASTREKKPTVSKAVIMGGGGTIYHPSSNTPAMTPDWASAKSIVAELLGINDIQRCSKGDIGSCGWAVAGILPIGKIVVAGRLLAASTKVAKSAEELLDAARATRNAKAAEVGRNKATVTGGYSRDGRVAAGCSSSPVGCAEDDVARQLGGNPGDIKFTEAMRPRTGRQVPVCPRCQEKYKPEQFPPDVLFDPSGAWGSK
ncbi:MAG: RHS repeat-associated core domain-containing protein [Micropruina sp.]